MSETKTTTDSPPISLHAEASSTNDLAMEAAESGAPHGSCWIADHQSAGRGRREIGGARRTWFSPPMSNLYMSVLLRPEVSPARAAGLTLAAAVGVRDALGAHGFEGAGIKWPNDILVGDRKLAGVLTEAVTRGGEISVVVGLGLNVNVSAAQVPDELAEIMTSLQIESGRRWDRMSLGLSLRDALLARCAQLVDEGLEGILEELRRHDVTAGRRVRTTVGEEAHEGRAQRIDDAGELIVELDDGSELSVAAGEVTFM